MDIKKILDLNRVVIDADSKSKKRTLELLGNILCESDNQDAEAPLSAQLITNSLCAREKLSSTAIGNGVALPHTRLKNLDVAVGALLVLKEPIDFDTLDNQPVDIFFGLLVPEDACEDHLQILAAIAKLFNDPKNSEHIRRLHDAQQVYDFSCKALSDTTPPMQQGTA